MHNDRRIILPRFNLEDDHFKIEQSGHFYQSQIRHGIIINKESNIERVKGSLTPLANVLIITCYACPPPQIKKILDSPLPLEKFLDETMSKGRFTILTLDFALRCIKFMTHENNQF